MTIAKRKTQKPTARKPVLDVRLRMEVADVSPPAGAWVARQLRAAAALAGVHGELNVVVVGDRRMALLHEQYKNVPGTTDVLTFDLSGNRRFIAGAAIAGDLVLCRDEARRQAKKRGHATRIELLLYAVHGMLHLCGYDDVTPAKAKRMHQREDELLTALGVGAVFSGD
jgi:probable rRNA maturation factor